jgi:hypothetical protein
MNKTRFYMTFLLLFIFIGNTAFNVFQGEIILDSLKVELWPEYDREDMLVIYRLSLGADVALPADVEIHVPSRVGDMYQVAMKDLDGLLYKLDYSIDMEKEWMVVSFTTPTPDVQIEFYDPALGLNGDHRSYEFVWFGDYRVNQCSVIIKEPLNASNLVSIPNAEPEVGFAGAQQIYEVQMGLIEQGSSFTLQLDYDKPDNILLSSLEEDVQPVAPIDDQIKGRTSFNEVLPWVFTMLSVIILFAAIILYLNSRNYPHKKLNNGDTIVQTDYSDVEPKAIYCHRCGKRAIKGDYYCRICGEKLQTEY